MNARHACAVLGLAAAVGAVVFTQSLVATNDHQAEAVAERLLKAVPVGEGAEATRLQLDYRPNGRVMQGPPMMAFVATRPGVEGALVTRALFAQRRLPVPALGTELTLVGRAGAYRVKIGGILEWERPTRGYPNVFVSPETAATIGEDWQPFETPTAAELAPGFKSDAGRHFDRAKPLLLWAAALTAVCLLLNSLFLTIESRRREIAILRLVGLTRGGVVKLVLKEALLLSLVGLAIGAAGACAALEIYVRFDPATFPMGSAINWRSLAAVLAFTPITALLAALLALRPALSVRPLEAASSHIPRTRRLGMLISFACGFGAFVAVEVWGASLTKPFIPSKEWPDAIVSILPGGISSFDIAKLQNLEGVRKIAELQPLQVNLLPLEKLPGPPRPQGDRPHPPKGTDPKAPGDRPRGSMGTDPKAPGDRPRGSMGTDPKAPGDRPQREAFRNALLLGSDWLPSFRFVSGTHTEAEKALMDGDACVVTEMMARARKLKKGDSLRLDLGRGQELALSIVGIVDLNWHMVTSRGLVRGLNRMPVNTDGPVFVSFDTLAACDPRPQDFVQMTHLWLDYKPEFLARHGVFPAGRLVERAIVRALDGADRVTEDGDVRGNTVRLHSRDEVADGTLAHGTALVGAMARIPFIFIAIVSLGFIAHLVASAESRRRELAVLRTVGATRLQIARILTFEATKTALGAIVLGLAGGSLVGWLCTAGTRAAMANWGLPACFDIPVQTVLLGGAGALAFALIVSVPTALAIVFRQTRR